MHGRGVQVAGGLSTLGAFWGEQGQCWGVSVLGCSRDAPQVTPEGGSDAAAGVEAQPRPRGDRLVGGRNGETALGGTPARPWGCPRPSCPSLSAVLCCSFFFQRRILDGSLGFAAGVSTAPLLLSAPACLLLLLRAPLVSPLAVAFRG